MKAIKWLPYQTKWINSQNKFMLAEKSRRIGLTYCEAFTAVKSRAINVNRNDYNFVSANAKTSLEFISYCKKFAEIINVALGEKYIDLRGSTQTQLSFENGSTIRAFSSNPAALRGYGGDVTLDEFAWHDQQEELYTAAAPLITWGGQLKIISTHAGNNTYFNHLCNKADEMKWDHHKTTLMDAVEMGLAKLIPGDHHEKESDKELNDYFIKSVRKQYSQQQWDQEYMCCPTTAGQQVISTDEYENCIKPKQIKDFIENADDRELYVGLDVGRTNDLTVAWVLNKIDDKYDTICIRSISGTDRSIPYQSNILDPIISHNDVETTCIDNTGLGVGLADDFINKYSNVTPINISLTLKRDMVERLRKFIQEERISLPNDPLIKEDICAMQTSVTPSGNITYGGKTKTTHCDYFMALALALHAAESEERATFSIY